MTTSNSNKLLAPSKAAKPGAVSKKKAPNSSSETAVRRTNTDQTTAKVEVAPKIKSKLVRDSFTIPKSEYQVLDLLKLRAINLKRPTKKGELLRAGIALLNTLSDSTFLAALKMIPSLKTGRPKAEG